LKFQKAKLKKNDPMAVYDYNEAVYGALCYIYGEDDDRISVEEKRGVKSRFVERHYLSQETMETISHRWSRDSEDFYWDVISSLNECSLTNRLEAYRTICVIINDFSAQRDDRWEPAHRIREAMDISIDDYNRYIGN
jgi:hypothetical protein